MRNPFKKKRKTFVSSQIVQILDEEYINNVPGITQAIMYSIFNDTNVADEIHTYITTGTAAQFKKFYNYGKNKFIRGLPSSTGLNITALDRGFLQYIRQQFGVSNRHILYAETGGGDFFHEGIAAINSLYGFNFVDQSVTLEGKKWECYSFNLAINNEDFESYEEDFLNNFHQFKTSVNPITLVGDGSDAADDIAMAPYFLGVIETYEKPINVIAGTNNHITANLRRWGKNPEYDAEEAAELNYDVPEYIWIYDSVSVSLPDTLITDLETRGYAVYLEAFGDNTFAVRHFSYTFETGNSALDALLNAPIPAVPSTFFPMAPIKTNHNYLEVGKGNSGNRALARSSDRLISRLDMNLSTFVNGLKGNDDSKNIREAVLMVGCPLKTHSEVQKRYLFDFLAKQYDGVGDVTDELIMRWRTTGYDTYIKHYGIERIEEKVTKPGNLQSNFETKIFLEDITERRNVRISEDTFEIQDVVIRRDKQFMASYYPDDETRISYKLRRPELAVFIQGSRYAFHEADSDEFIIPVDYEIVRNYRRSIQEELLLRCLYMQVSVLVRVKVKWYQRSWFRVVTIVAAVALAVFSGGAAIGAIGAAVGSGVFAVASVIGQIILTAIVVKVAASYLIEQLGPKYALIAAIAATIASAYFGATVNFDVGGLVQTVDLLNIALNLVDYVVQGIEVITEKMLEAGYEEISELQKEMSRLTEIAESENLLGERHWIVPMLLLGEGPEQFYSRTIGNTNPGLQSIEQVTYYVESQLALPDAYIENLKLESEESV